MRPYLISFIIFLTGSLFVVQCSGGQSRTAVVSQEGPPYLGILYVDTRRGSIVRQVFSDSPAERSGMRPGDRITEAGTYRVGGIMGLHQSIARMQPGDELRLVFMRDGLMQTTVAVLAVAPPKMRNPYQMPRYALPR